MNEDAASADHRTERDRLSRASILVVGDALLFRRVEGRWPARAGAGADEAPLPALLLGDEHAAPGGGAALVDALGRLGVASAFVCVLGDDLAGAQLTELIGRQRNVEPWLLVDGSRCTVTETAYRDGGRILFRTVREDARPVSPALRARMMRIATETLALTGLVLLADRGHGTLDPETTAAVIAGARVAGRLVVADLGPVHALAGQYGGLDALLLASRPGVDPEAAARAVWAEAEVRAAVLLAADGTIAVADKDGTARFGPAPRSDGAASDGAASGGAASGGDEAADEAGHVRRAASFAAAMATGRTARRAASVAASLG